MLSRAKIGSKNFKIMNVEMSQNVSVM